MGLRLLQEEGPNWHSPGQIMWHWGMEAALTREGKVQGAFKCVKATGCCKTTVKHLKKCPAWQITTQIGRVCLSAQCCSRENEGKQEGFMDQLNPISCMEYHNNNSILCVKFGSVFIRFTEGWERVDNGEKSPLNMEQSEFRLHFESCTS